MIDACYDYKDAEKLIYKRQIELINARFISGFDSNIAITGLNNEGDFEIYPMKRKILTDNELIKMKVNFTLVNYPQAEDLWACHEVNGLRTIE